MPLPVAHHHSPIPLRSACIGQPVGAMHTLHHVDTLTFLLGRVGHVVGSTSVSAASAGTSTTTKIAYRRSPGAQVLCVEIELRATTGAYARVTASIVGGTAPRIPDGTDLLGGHLLDGTHDVACDPAYTRHRNAYRCFFDVSGLSTGTTVEVTVNHNDYASLSSGVRRITAVEIPLVSMDPVGDPATEMGIDGAWPSAGNDLVEGDSSSPRGWYRVFDQMVKARTLWRRHVQFAAREDTLGAFSTNSLTNVNMLGGGSGAFRTRVRRIRANTVDNPQIVYVRYMAVSGGKLRLDITPVDGVLTTTDIVLPPSGSFTSLASTVNFPTSGTDQEIDIHPQFLTNLGANPMYISLCAPGIEAEV